MVPADCPDMPKEYLERALRIISKKNDTIVVGPSSDGAFNLIGANVNNMAPVNKGLTGIDWSPEFSLKKMMGQFKKLDIPVHVLPQWHDIIRSLIWSAS